MVNRRTVENFPILRCASLGKPSTCQRNVSDYLPRDASSGIVFYSAVGRRFYPLPSLKRFSFLFIICLFTLFVATGCGGGGGGGGADCGGPTGIACPAGQFCRLDALNCVGSDATGFCDDTPPSCGAEVAPVCTCDALTFDNECLAEAAGQTVTAQGECA